MTYYSLLQNFSVFTTNQEAPEKMAWLVATLWHSIKHDALLALWRSFSKNDFSGMQLVGGIGL